MTLELAEAILRLAERVGRLKPSRNDPERFFCDRSDIEESLKRIASELSDVMARRDPERARQAFRASKGGEIAVNGRLIKVTMRRRRAPMAE